MTEREPELSGRHGGRRAPGASRLPDDSVPVSTPPTAAASDFARDPGQQAERAAGVAALRPGAGPGALPAGGTAGLLHLVRAAGRGRAPHRTQSGWRGSPNSRCPRNACGPSVCREEGGSGVARSSRVARPRAGGLQAMCGALCEKRPGRDVVCVRWDGWALWEQLSGSREPCVGASGVGAPNVRNFPMPTARATGSSHGWRKLI